MHRLAFITSLFVLLLSFISPSWANEPLLLVEFTGTVTGNTLSCTRQHYSCPSENHFGAPWAEDSMVGDPMFERVKGKLYVAYTRGQVRFSRGSSARSIDVRVDSASHVNIVSGDIVVAGVPVDIDRDYKGLTGGIRERGFTDAFAMADRPSWPRASFIANSHTHSGHSYYTIRDGRRQLRAKRFAQTQLLFQWEIYDLPKGEWFFGPMFERSLPGFEWVRTPGEHLNDRGSLRLLDFRMDYSEEVGRKYVQSNTYVTFALDSIRVIPISSVPPGDEPEPAPIPDPAPDPEKGKVPFAPETLDIE